MFHHTQVILSSVFSPSLSKQHIIPCRKKHGTVSLVAVCFVLFYFWLAPAAIAQGPNLKLKYFTQEDGIFNSSIYHIAQDSDGYIWVATRDGLYKYNGYSFSIYLNRAGDSTSIPGNVINYLYNDSKGKLWVATTAGLCTYNREQDHFYRIADNGMNAGITGINIRQVIEDTQGNIYIHNGQSIFRFLPEEKLFRQVDSLETGQILNLIIENSECMLLGCTREKGLQRLHLNTGQLEPVLIAGNKPDLLSHSNIPQLHLKGDQLWIANMGNGIQILDMKTGRLRQIPYIDEDDANKFGLMIDHNDNLWAIDFTGLKLLDKNTYKLISYYPQSLHATNIKNDLKGIFEDRQGNLWFFHEPGGLGISMVQKGFSNFSNDSLQNWYTSNGNVTSISPDTEGNFWIGYYDSGIDIFDWKKNKIIKHRYNTNNPNSIGRGSTLVIFKDSKGVMWAGTYFDGLQYYDVKNKCFVRFKNNPLDCTSIAGNDVRSIAEDKKGNLWLAVHGKGIDRMDPATGKFVHYNTKNSGLSNNWTFQVFLDDKENLWVGSGWGLSCLKKGESSFRTYFSSQIDSCSLTSNNIACIYQDVEKRMWIGTDAGLNMYDPKNDRFVRFDNNFANTHICSIINDADSVLWISTLKGIFRFHPEKGDLINFTRNDGLISDEFNARAAYINEKNEIFFCGTKGIDYFNPRNLIYNTAPPPVLIDKLVVLNKELTPHNSAILSKDIKYTEKITLPFSDNFITLGFVALNYNNPHQNQYAYILEGFEKTWHDAGTSREATYTNLDPGTYTFRVIAANNDGIWNKEGGMLTIEILPPWYRTMIFKLFLVILIISLIYATISVRTATLERQKNVLEAAVTEKVSELTEKNELLKRHAIRMDENNRLLVDRQNLLEQQSEELKIQSEHLESANMELQKLMKMRDKIFSVIAHDLSSPFQTILGFSDYILKKYDTLSDEEKKSYISAILNSSERNHALLQNLLLWAKSQTKGISFTPAQIPLRKTIDAVVDLRSENLVNKKITVQVNCSEDSVAWADAEMLKTIFRNLLSNAIKFTPEGGNIKINVKEYGQFVQISFINSGSVLPPDKIEKILSSDIIQSEPGTAGEGGSGFGLTICKEFIKRNKGKLDITSDAANGTSFIVYLPVEQV